MQMRRLILGVPRAGVVDVGQLVERELAIDLDRPSRSVGRRRRAVVVLGELLQIARDRPETASGR